MTLSHNHVFLNPRARKDIAHPLGEASLLLSSVQVRHPGAWLSHSPLCPKRPTASSLLVGSWKQVQDPTLIVLIPSAYLSIFFGASQTMDEEPEKLFQLQREREWCLDKIPGFLPPSPALLHSREGNTLKPPATNHWPQQQPQALCPRMTLVQIIHMDNSNLHYHLPSVCD